MSDNYFPVKCSYCGAILEPGSPAYLDAMKSITATAELFGCRELHKHKLLQNHRLDFNAPTPSNHNPA